MTKHALIAAIVLAMIFNTACGATPPSEPTKAEIDMLLRAENWQEAIEALSDYTASHPDDVWGWTLLGLAERHAGNYDAAITAYEKVLPLQPDSLSALIGLSLIYADQGKQKEACDYIEQASAAGLRVEDLRTNDIYDPLRGYACFEKLVSG